MSRKVKIPSYRVKLVRDRTNLVCHEPVRAYDVLRRAISDHARESMHVLYLDGRSRVVGHEMVAMGGADSLCVAAREVFRGAIKGGAYAIVMGHNHPSGSTSPTDADRAMTEAIRAAGEIIGIPLVDHIIVTEHNGYYSMLDSGELGPEQEAA